MGHCSGVGPVGVSFDYRGDADVKSVETGPQEFFLSSYAVCVLKEYAAMGCGGGYHVAPTE